MHRRTIVLSLLLICWLLPMAAPALANSTYPSPARVTQIDASRYPDVTVFVRVTDDGGNLVGGLSASDFAVTEGGAPVQLTGFSGGGASPVTTALVIDRSGSMAEAGKLRGAQDAARAFIAQMRPGDSTAVLAFSSAPEPAGAFSGDASELLDQVDGLEADGGTALYDSIVAGVDALRNVPGRRALLVLTDGQDCRDDPQCPDEYGSQRSAAQAIEYARAAGQPVYVVGLGDRGGYGTAGVDEGVLQRIGGETDGEYYYAPDAARLAALYRSLSADIQSEYALTYRSPRPFYDGTRRDIMVSLGGAPAAFGDYLQQNLITVRSNPVVGFVLLVPLVWALLLPGMLRRRPRAAKVAAGGSATDIAQRAAGLAPLASAPAAAEGAAAEGATMIQPAGAGRAFCVECGRPLRAGARFCSDCGAPAGSQVSA